MKKLIFLLALIITVAVSGQNTISYQLINSDTLTNTDTISGVYPGVISDDYYYSVQIVCDSLTGGPAGTAVLQQGDDLTPEKWTNITSMTLSLNGALIYQDLWEGGVTPFLGTKLRVYILGTGTATIDCNAWLVLKKK